MQKIFKGCATLLLLAAAGINMAAFAQVVNVHSQWSSGNLQFVDGSLNPVLTVGPTSVNVESGVALQLNGQPITATGTQLNQYSVNAYLSDAGTAGSAYVVVPHGGVIKSIAVTNYAANATAATTFLAKIGGVTVTAPTWQLGATATAGTNASVVPTAANTMTSNTVLELNSDGGSSSVMPVEFTVVIQRQ